MSAPHTQLRRIAVAFCISIVIVVATAALLPRAYLVNDDPGFVIYLRLGAYAPWLSSVLSWLLVSLYRLSPDLPWYGLYMYALLIATGAVLIHACVELIDPRPGFGRVATWLGTIMLAASIIVVAIGMTWTTVSISALGTALVAWVAYLHIAQARGLRASPLRGLSYGLLFVAGFVLRPAGIAAVGAAVLPLLAWIGLRFVLARHVPRPLAVFAFLAPIVIVVIAQGWISPSGERGDEQFNVQRGRISGAAAFGNLDRRAPELLTNAGWTVDEYRDFSNWLLADNTEFTTDKVRRLADTGGKPTSFGLADSYMELRSIADDSAVSVWLFLTSVAGAIVLAWLGVIDRRRGVLFSVGYLLFVMIVPVALAAFSRFPQRLSLSFYTVAALGMFVFLATEIASRMRPEDNHRRGDLGLLVIALFVIAWARSLIGWTDREPWPYHRTLQEFANRVNARHGMIMMAEGIAEMDPLLADPRGYDALPSGWGTFTAPWYEYIERFGIHSGSEFLHAMIDDPNAYVVGLPYGHEMFEEWIRRRSHDPSVRLSLVDSAAGMPKAVRSELYRLVTTPLVRGSEEWQQLAKNEARDAEELPGPPDVSGRTFRSIAFIAPTDAYALKFRDDNPSVTDPVPDGIRSTVRSAEDGCIVHGEVSELAGIKIPVHGLAAARFELSLLESEHIVAVDVAAKTETQRSLHWRWQLDEAARELGYSGTITLVPGHPAHRLELTSSSARPHDIRELDVWLEVEPAAHAGFELRHVEVAEP